MGVSARTASSEVNMSAYQHLPNITTNTKSPGKPAWEEDRVEDTVTQLPLPDIVLCSALSAGIAQARRHRRQRHPATVQTPGSLTPNNDPDTLMEPLIPGLKQRTSMEGLVRQLLKLSLRLK